MPEPISEAELEEKLRAVERWATIMDEAFLVPGTKIRFGIDSLIGLFPGLGDTVSFMTHGYLLWVGYQAGIRKRVHARMLLNAVIDLIGGAPPILGDIFDVFWRSNRKNVDLLREELRRMDPSRHPPMNRHPPIHQANRS